MIRISKLYIPPISVISLCALFILEPGIYFFIILFSVLFHELCHILVMRFLKIRISSLTLLPLGIDIKSRGETAGYKKQIAVSLAGALGNLFLFFIFKSSHSFFAYTNLLYALFNLLPIKGLDGGEVLLGFFCLFLEADKSENILKAVSFVFCVILWVIGVYILFILNGNISIFALSVFLFASIFIKTENCL